MAQFLPNANFISGSGSLSSSDLNKIANDPRDLTATVAAQGALVPLLYGKRDVPGLVFAQGKIGTDLVIAYMWCAGEIQAIDAIYINDAAVPGGVTVTNYLGTSTQTVDATLASAIAGYNDRVRVSLPGGTFLGIAYSVFRIPVGQLTSFPRVRAVIRGRKLYDPRTLTTAYSDNPALALYDLITNPFYGLGRTCLGAPEAANWCDSLLGGVAGAYRARIGLYISTGRPAEEYIDLLCEYAECFQVYEGQSVRLIPDQPVDLDLVPVVDSSKMLKDSLSIQAESSSDTPTEVEFQYTDEPSIASQPWSLVPTVVQLPGVPEGDIQRIPTSVTMEGVTREIEAVNKALSRLYRMQNRLTVSWTTTDAGVVQQKGDVVKVQNALRGVDLPVRIMGVNLVSPGRYSVSSKLYDISHYPSDLVLPEDTGIVPIGAIGMLIGTVVPDGWELFNAANDKFIIGAGGTYAVGATAASTSGPWTGSVSGGAHNKSNDFPSPAAGPSSVPAYYNPASDTGTVGNHTHTWSVPSVNENILRRENVLVRKITSDGLLIPSTVRVFGLSNIITPATKNTSFNGRLLMPKTISANAGVSTQAGTNITTGSGNDSHQHYSSFLSTANTFGGVGSVQARNHNSAGGVHTHSASVVPTFNPKRKKLCCFEAAIDYEVVPGMIWLWSGSIGALPTDYVLCDGTNGTPDMRDYFVEFSDTSGTASGNNTMNLNATTDNNGHSHYGAVLTSVSITNAYGHAYTQSHNHTISASSSYVPKYYALAFIMYVPA